MSYEYGIDFDAVGAIDIHTHVEVDGHGHNSYDEELVDATRSYFKMGDTAAATVDELADHYPRRNAVAVVFTIDAETAMGHAPKSVEDQITGATRNHVLLAPFW